MEKVLATTYLHEFDRELQGPTWGYPTEGAYYRDAASTDPLLAVRIPFFTIHAEDDPVGHSFNTTRVQLAKRYTGGAEGGSSN